VKAFLSAFTKGAKDVMANPAAVHRLRQGARRHHQRRPGNPPPALAIDTVINSPDARAEGFGQVNGPAAWR
jgi:NitT/TauT family transport system substrate-binding protein